MNTAKAIELAFSEVFRKYATLGAGTVIRAWQSIEADGSIDTEKKDRDFPCIDIRCAPAKPDEVQATLQSDCAFLIFTKIDDDKNHAVHSAIQTEVERILFLLFKQFRKRTPSDPEIADFVASLSANLPATDFVFSALSLGDGAAPFMEEGLNASGYGMSVRWFNPHFAY